MLVGVTGPLEVLWQSTTDDSSSVSSVNATMTDLPAGSFAPPPSDPDDTSIVIAADAVYHIATQGEGGNGYITKVTTAP